MFFWVRASAHLQSGGLNEEINFRKIQTSPLRYRHPQTDEQNCLMKQITVISS